MANFLSSKRKSRANQDKCEAKFCCIECRKEIDELLHFLHKRWTCQDCGYSTQCRNSMARHRSHNDCISAKSVRCLFGIPSSNTFTGKLPQKLQLLSCSSCNFNTRNTHQMAIHMHGSRCKATRILCRAEADLPTDMQKDKDEGKHEAELFGLLTLIDFDESEVPKFLRAPKGREIEFEHLTEILRPDHARKIVQRKIGFKNLLDKIVHRSDSSKDMSTAFSLALNRPSKTNSSMQNGEKSEKKSDKKNPMRDFL